MRKTRVEENRVHSTFTLEWVYVYVHVEMCMCMPVLYVCTHREHSWKVHKLEMFIATRGEHGGQNNKKLHFLL